MVALRQRSFQFSDRPSGDALAAYCEEVFCRNPWRDEDLPSLVYEDERGRMAGFLGVIPRLMRFRGEVIRAAIGTQLMVAPESRGLAGLRIARAFFSGPQDLSISDTANDVARRLWEGINGSVSLVHSLAWRLVLRPARCVLSGGSDHLLRRGVRLALRPAAALVDTLAAQRGPFRQRRPAGNTEPLDAENLAQHADAVFSRWALRPVYDAASLSWILARAREKRQFGPMHGALVRDTKGAVAGWFLYYGSRGGVAQVLQLAAGRAHERLVLSWLRYHAWQLGARELSGRFDASLLRPLQEAGAVLQPAGPWMLYHSSRPEIQQELERGHAFVSRLDGEWWLSF